MDPPSPSAGWLGATTNKPTLWIFIHSLKDCFQSTYHGPDTPLNIGEAAKNNKGNDPVFIGYILVGQAENQYINGEKQEITDAR